MNGEVLPRNFSIDPPNIGLFATQNVTTTICIDQHVHMFYYLEQLHPFLSRFSHRPFFDSPL